MATKKPIKKEDTLLESMDKFSALVDENVFTDYLDIIVKDDGKFKNARIEWNLKTKCSKITLGDVAADSGYRAEYEARKYLSEYILRTRGEKNE